MARDAAPRRGGRARRRPRSRRVRPQRGDAAAHRRLARPRRRAPRGRRHPDPAAGAGAAPAVRPSASVRDPARVGAHTRAVAARVVVRGHGRRARPRLLRDGAAPGNGLRACHPAGAARRPRARPADVRGHGRPDRGDPLRRPPRDGPRRDRRRARLPRSRARPLGRRGPARAARPPPGARAIGAGAPRAPAGAVPDDHAGARRRQTRELRLRGWGGHRGLRLGDGDASATRSPTSVGRKCCG